MTLAGGPSLYPAVISALAVRNCSWRGRIAKLSAEKTFLGAETLLSSLRLAFCQNSALATDNVCEIQAQRWFFEKCRL